MSLHPGTAAYNPADNSDFTRRAEALALGITHPDPGRSPDGRRSYPHAPISRPLWASMIASHGRVASRRILRARARRRLNPLFVGLLMGWPSRSRALRLLGNGVHPLAAAHAWRALATAHGLRPVDLAADARAGRPSADDPL